jgi:Tfp pilus assembly protein PilN
MSSLDALRWQRLMPAARAFWRWWIAELRATRRDLLTGLAGFSGSRWTLVITEDTCWVTERHGTEETRHSTVALSSGPHALAEERRLLQWPRDMFRRPVTVLVPQSWVLVKLLNLPRAVARHLRGTVDLQFERHCPLPRSQVLWDVELETHDEDHPRLTARLGLIKRAELEPLLARLAEWNVNVQSVAVLTDGRAVFNFLPQRRAPAPAIAVSTLNHGLAVSAGVLALTVLGLAIALLRHETSSLESALSDAQQAARPVETLRATVSRNIRQAQAIQALDERSLFPQLLSELTQHLPASVWIQELEVEGTQARVRGLAPAGTNLVSLLATAPIVEKSEVRSLQSAGLGTQQDRFELSLTLRPPGNS